MSYEDRLMEDLREQIGLDADDRSQDDRIKEMLPDEKWNRFLMWNGIQGYGSLLHKIHELIYHPEEEDNDEG